MWQSPHTRHTQRRRRSHLGVLACLLAALCSGVLIGRLTDGVNASGEIYLQTTAPPSAKPAATKQQPQSNLGKIARETNTPRGKGAIPKTTHTPTSQAEVPGDTIDDPTRVLGGKDPLDVSPSMADEVVRLTNAARAKRGCAPLRVDTRLTRSARAHSLEMARSNQFTHDSPDGSSPWDRMGRAGYRDGAAENIGRGYTTAQEAVSGWLASRDHRGNMLNCKYAAIGVGVVSGGGGPWWTQDFGYS